MSVVRSQFLGVFPLPLLSINTGQSLLSIFRDFSLHLLSMNTGQICFKFLFFSPKSLVLSTKHRPKFAFSFSGFFPDVSVQTRQFHQYFLEDFRLCKLNLHLISSCNTSF